MDDKELQQEYMKFHVLDNQMKQVEKELHMIAAQKEEVIGTKKALENLQTVKEETHILAPISNGIFVKAALKANDTLIVNVGNNVTVEKTVPQTIQLLDEQFVELDKVYRQLTTDLQSLEDKLISFKEKLDHVQKT